MMPRIIAKLRRPPYNRSTQEIGDLTPQQIADIFAPEDGQVYSPQHFDWKNGPLTRIPEFLRPTIR